MSSLPMHFVTYGVIFVLCVLWAILAILFMRCLRTHGDVLGLYEDLMRDVTGAKSFSLCVCHQLTYAGRHRSSVAEHYAEFQHTVRDTAAWCFGWCSCMCSVSAHDLTCLCFVAFLASGQPWVGCRRRLRYLFHHLLAVALGQKVARPRCATHRTAP